eukprot:COSAG01_NODE_4117_length_5335_cov_5.427617_5_plen_111_part_00
MNGGVLHKYIHTYIHTYIQHTYITRHSFIYLVTRDGFVSPCFSPPARTVLACGTLVLGCHTPHAPPRRARQDTSLRRHARHLPVTVAGLETHGASTVCVARARRLPVPDE